MTETTSFRCLVSTAVLAGVLGLGLLATMDGSDLPRRQEPARPCVVTISGDTQEDDVPFTSCDIQRISPQRAALLDIFNAAVGGGGGGSWSGS